LFSPHPQVSSEPHAKMIQYESGGCYFFLNCFKLYGSVFPKAIRISLPCGAITGLMAYIIHYRSLFDALEDESSVMRNNAVWGGFSFLVGFLIVFRTSQAYNRFWEGCTSTHKMGVEWFDSCAALVAFTKASIAPPEQTLAFQHTLIRLFSMLHAAALGEIEDCGEGDEDVHYSAVEAFKMELLDPDAIDELSLETVRDSNAKVELIFQWIQQLVVENMATGVMCIPPPILTRAFQEIAAGMVHFHDAMKISNVPFPFPYAQTCDSILMMHWLLTPFIVCSWVGSFWWATIFSFMQVFTLWTLNLIAIELENPFGRDPNDIDGERMQLVMNNHLRMLISDAQVRTPSLRFRLEVDPAQSAVLSTGLQEKRRSFNAIWKEMHMPSQTSLNPLDCSVNARVSRKRFSVASMQSTNSLPQPFSPLPSLRTFSARSSGNLPRRRDLPASVIMEECYGSSQGTSASRGSVSEDKSHRVATSSARRGDREGGGAEAAGGGLHPQLEEPGDAGGTPKALDASSELSYPAAFTSGIFTSEGFDERTRAL